MAACAKPIQPPLRLLVDAKHEDIGIEVPVGRQRLSARGPGRENLEHQVALPAMASSALSPRGPMREDRSSAFPGASLQATYNRSWIPITRTTDGGNNAPRRSKVCPSTASMGTAMQLFETARLTKSARGRQSREQVAFLEMQLRTLQRLLVDRSHESADSRATIGMQVADCNVCSWSIDTRPQRATKVFPMRSSAGNVDPWRLRPGTADSPQRCIAAKRRIKTPILITTAP